VARSHSLPFVAGALGFLIAGCGAPGEGGGAVDLCTVVLAPSETVLEPEVGGAYDEPGPQVARDARGNYYGGALAGGRLLKWDASGRFVASTGRVGGGPGEFAPGPLIVFVSPDDSLFVRDNSSRFLVFDTALTYHRAFPTGPVLALSAGELHFLPDGRIASTFQRPSATSFDLMFLDRDGNVTDTLLPREPGPGTSRAPANRSSAFVPPSTLWLAPPPGVGGYEVDIVDLDGSPVGRLAPEAPWFDVTTRRTMPNEHGGRRAFPYPTVGLVVADREGLVWIWSYVPKVPDAAARYFAADLGELLTVSREVLASRVDVYEAATLRPVAVGTVPHSAVEAITPLFNSREVLRVRTDSLGVRSSSIARLALRSGDGGVCALDARRAGESGR